MSKLIKKKNGQCRQYDFIFVKEAVEASACFARPISFQKGEVVTNVYPNGTHLSDDEWALLEQLVEEAISILDEPIPTSEMHEVVITALGKVDTAIQSAYCSYHLDKKAFYQSLETALEERDENQHSMNVSNANALSSLAVTQKSLSADCFERRLNQSLLMTPADLEAHEQGYLYWNDLSNLSIFPYNCCLFRGGEVIKKTFTINGVTCTPPKTLREAFVSLSSVMSMTASNQYGGLTQPRIDTVLAPYAEYSYQQYVSSYCNMGVSLQLAKTHALHSVLEDMHTGFEDMEVKFNTEGSARGDFPFIAITGGVDDTCMSHHWAALLWSAALKVRMIGHGEEGKKRPALFPKLIFLYDEEKHGVGKSLEWLYEIALKCSSKNMYPDYLSLSGDGYVPSMYQKYKDVSPDLAIISPMGCRAFLSPWYVKGGMEPADDSDYPVFEGRFNIGVISLNLPMIFGKAKKEGVDFFQLLDFYLELIRNAFRRRYAKLAQYPASRNPFMFCYGGALGGDLDPSDKIEPLLKSATASFGITALNELQQFYNGKSLVEDGEFALTVMAYINEKVNSFKKQDGHLYAVYGTPAETLCGRQARQLRDAYGIIPGVSDREYVSNSFHCHVTEQISPVQKQDLEYRFWNYFNGGKIQYCKYPLAYNEDAIRTLVNRAMEMGLYEGVNLDLCFCADCGESRVEMPEECPVCHSRDIYEVNRMNGYLGYSRMKSKNGKGARFNRAKLIEISERVSM